MGYGVGVVRKRAPEVGHKAVKVVDRFDALTIRRGQQHGGAACEWLDVVAHNAKGGPGGFCGFAFSTEIGEWGL